jgi:hypothetical protein
MHKLLVIIECLALHIRKLVEFAVQSDGGLKAIDPSSFGCGYRHSPVDLTISAIREAIYRERNRTGSADWCSSGFGGVSHWVLSNANGKSH